MYMLVCCCEREIETPRFFKSWEEAHAAMCADVAATLIVPVEDIKESYLNGKEYDDDTCVIDYSAWAEHHGQNFDWKIFCLDAVPIKQQIVATEVESCPFCGGEAGVDGYRDDVDGVWFYYAYCDSCGAETAKFKNPEAAVKSWNRRYKGDSKTTLVCVR